MEPSKPAACAGENAFLREPLVAHPAALREFRPALKVLQNHALIASCILIDPLLSNSEIVDKQDSHPILRHAAKKLLGVTLWSLDCGTLHSYPPLWLQEMVSVCFRMAEMVRAALDPGIVSARKPLARCPARSTASQSGEKVRPASTRQPCIGCICFGGNVNDQHSAVS